MLLTACTLSTPLRLGVGPAGLNPPDKSYLHLGFRTANNFGYGFWSGEDEGRGEKEE
jgi:hypothetical protein